MGLDQLSPPNSTPCLPWQKECHFTTGIISSFPSVSGYAHISARVTTQYLAKHNVPVLEWPAQSSDLSPIEHL